MAARFEGKILIHSRSRSGRSADYFVQQRQMTLDFAAALPLTRRASVMR
jgi:hypothetical protein